MKSDVLTLPSNGEGFQRGDQRIELASDATARSYDADGHLYISKSNISKSCVNPYYGQEIPGYKKLGLDAYKVYYMFRDPVELARAASTFVGKPILSRHVPVSADAHRPDLVVGAIGSNVEFEDPYLKADLTFWDANSIAGIETETVRELSCAYRYKPDMTPGEWHGQRYDGVMREIACNHLAQVEAGRAGSDVLAADGELMKTTKMGKALIKTLGAMSPKLAQDSALPALVGKATGKTFKADEVSAKLMALDAELDPKQLKIVLGAFDEMSNGGYGRDEDMDEDDDDPAQDDDVEEEKKKLAKDKMAKDAEEKDKDDKKAMDAKIATATAAIKSDLREADEARRAVRDVAGEVALDSAFDIYAFALDHLKVDRKDVTGVPAVKALFNLAKSHQSTVVAPIAMDAKGALSQFPNIARFRSI